MKISFGTGRPAAHLSDSIINPMKRVKRKQVTGTGGLAARRRYVDTQCIQCSASFESCLVGLGAFDKPMKVCGKCALMKIADEECVQAAMEMQRQTTRYRV